MNHIITRRVDDEVEVIYQRSTREQDTLKKEEFVSYKTARIFMGCAWTDDIYYACIIAERVFWSRDRKNWASLYVCLDEVDLRDVSEYFSALVKLKDLYLIERVCIPATPKDFADRIERMEGLTNYRKEKSDAEYKNIFSSFVSRNTKAFVSKDLPPSRSEVLSTVKVLMNEPVIDVDEYTEIYDVGLVIPYDLKVEKLRLALERATEPYIYALWFALNRFASITPKKRKEDFFDEDAPKYHRWTPNKKTGY